MALGAVGLAYDRNNQIVYILDLTGGGILWVFNVANQNAATNLGTTFSEGSNGTVIGDTITIDVSDGSLFNSLSVGDQFSIYSNATTSIGKYSFQGVLSGGSPGQVSATLITPPNGGLIGSPWTITGVPTGTPTLAMTPLGTIQLEPLTSFSTWFNRVEVDGYTGNVILFSGNTCVAIQAVVGGVISPTVLANVGLGDTLIDYTVSGVGNGGGGFVYAFGSVALTIISTTSFAYTNYDYLGNVGTVTIGTTVQFTTDNNGQNWWLTYDDFAAGNVPRSVYMQLDTGNGQPTGNNSAANFNDSPTNINSHYGVNPGWSQYITSNWTLVQWGGEPPPSQSQGTPVLFNVTVGSNIMGWLFNGQSNPAYICGYSGNLFTFDGSAYNQVYNFPSLPHPGWPIGGLWPDDEAVSFPSTDSAGIYAFYYTLSGGGVLPANSGYLYRYSIDSGTFFQIPFGLGFGQPLSEIPYTPFQFFEGHATQETGAPAENVYRPFQLLEGTKDAPAKPTATTYALRAIDRGAPTQPHFLYWVSNIPSTLGYPGGNPPYGGPLIDFQILAQWSVPIPPTVFVFQPGGSPEYNVYTTEAALAAAIAISNGPITLFFDLSLVSNTYTFTTVGHLNLGQFTTWIAAQGDALILFFANGTTLAWPPVAIQGAVRVNVTQSATVCTLAAPAVTNLYDHAQVFSNGGYLVDSGSTSWSVNMYGSATFGGGTDQLTTGAVNVSLYDVVQVQSLAGGVGLTTSVFSSGAKLDASFYPTAFIGTILFDTTGTATATIPPGNLLNGQGYILETGVLYYSDGTSWTATGGGGGGGPTTVFVFQPGGIAGGNVYTTEASLATAIAAINGPVTIQFEFIPGSGAYQPVNGFFDWGQETTWTDSFQGSTIQFANGTTLAYPPIEVRGSLIVAVLQSETVCTLGGDMAHTAVHDSAYLYSTVGLFVDASASSWVGSFYGSSGLEGVVGGQVIGGPCTINLYDQTFVNDGLPVNSSTVIVANSASINSISSNYYPYTFISGLFVDQIGSATSLIPPSNLQNQFGYILQGGLLYYSTGTNWVQAPAFSAGGDLTGTITSQQVQSVTGQGTGQYGASSPGAYIPITAGETRLAAGTAWESNGAACGLTTTDASAHTIISYAPPVDSSHRIALSIVARNAANNGDEFSADYSFHLSTITGLSPSPPTAQNTYANGGAVGYAVAFSFSGGSLTISVTGAASTTVNWNATIQDVGRS